MFNKGDAVLCIRGGTIPGSNLATKPGQYPGVKAPKKGMIYVVAGGGHQPDFIRIEGLPCKFVGGDAGWRYDRFKKLVDPDSKGTEEPVVIKTKLPAVVRAEPQRA